ncbi:MAG: tRNA (N(6)-L-threonylcarbamoyladenosine(37)-C(2))-methylthiotransferase MtaB [Chitinivibrionales bacterium]
MTQQLEQLPMSDQKKSPSEAKAVVALKSVGCRTNQEEMTALAFSLSGHGFDITQAIDRADIIIVNSCSVTSCSESKTRRLVHSIARKAPLAQICVTGCLAQQQGSELLELPNVCWVVGNRHKDHISHIIQSSEKGLFVSPVADITQLRAPEPMSTAVWQGRTRFPLKIQEGCNFNCSYCIVPSLRGPSRSAEHHTLYTRCEEAVASGFKEIVITGTHIGQYAADGAADLPKLLQRLLGVDGDYRIRLSSLDPRDLSDELLDLVGNEKKMCRHVHISVQSFSAEVLKAMHRPYRDLEKLIERIKRFRQDCSDAGLGGDFIVGFPGETDTQFRHTLEAIKEIGFTYGHVFRFSKRPGTPAAAMKHQIASSIKKKRSEALRDHLAAQQQRFIQRCKNSPQTIIVEKEKPVYGVTSNYIRVELPQLRAPKNSWQQVLLSGEKTAGGRWEAILSED